MQLIYSTLISEMISEISNFGATSDYANQNHRW